MFFPFVLSIVVGTAESLYNSDHHDDRRMPVLLGAQNVRDRSTNGVDEKTFGQVKEILKLNLTTNEKSKLITRWIETERKNAAEQLKEKNDEIKEMAGDIRELKKDKEAVVKQLSKVMLRAIINDIEDDFGYGYNETEAKALNITREQHWRFILTSCLYDPRVRAMVDVLKKRITYSFPKTEYETASNIADVCKKLSKYIHVDLAQEAGELRITLSFNADPLFESALEVIQPAFSTKNIKIVYT